MWFRDGQNSCLAQARSRFQDPFPSRSPRSREHPHPARGRCWLFEPGDWAALFPGLNLGRRGVCSARSRRGRIRPSFIPVRISMNKLFAAIALFVLAGCSQGDSSFRQGQASTAAPAFGLVSTGAYTGDAAYEVRIRQRGSFAALPDRGELISYADTDAGHSARVQGAYTWHRVDISEEHALRAIVGGHLRVPTPSGQSLDIRYDHHIEHPSGDLTWVGHVDGRPDAQTIITFGAEAAYGSIGQPGKRSLRLTTRNGAGWVVETDPSKLVGIASAGANPRESDALAVPKTQLGSAGTSLARAGTQPAQGTSTAMATAAASATIDILIGYTQGFASATPGVMTRLNQMVAVGNEALANSQVSARIRLVHAMQVSYTDTSTNESALEQLTGYDSGAGQYTTPNAAFNALRVARETYGADLVALVRDFRDPEQDGCGIAWLIGGGQSGISPGDGQDYFGYSVVSDGYDENGGATYYCREETLVHELAHNIGSQHDRAAARGDDGTLDPDDYGAFAYSFGLKTTATAGNFFTIMAYGEENQQDYRVFSNPRITAVCGGRACGTANDDNARSLANLMPIVATFRDTKVLEAKAGVLSGNFNGDSRSDILWRHGGRGENTIWLSGYSNAQQAVTDVTDVRWQVAGTGDFNGDGRSDILWRHGTRGENAIWLSGNSGMQQAATDVTDVRWQVAGIGDFNGDRRSDILWRHGARGTNAIWLSGSSGMQQAVTDVTDVLWQVAGIGDFNGDRRSDILWRHGARGENAIWLSGNSGTEQAATDVADVRWQVAGIGDFNGDGRSDILWRHGTLGQNAIWLSGNNNAQRAVSNVAEVVWRIVG